MAACIFYGNATSSTDALQNALGNCEKNYFLFLNQMTGLWFVKENKLDCALAVMESEAAPGKFLNALLKLFGVKAARLKASRPEIWSFLSSQKLLEY
jgi:hypothetical protein